MSAVFPRSRRQPRFNGFLLLAAAGQGLYYVAIGIWAALALDSFTAVTGPKTDIWLVRTVGLLIVAAGIVLLVSGLRAKAVFEIALLAVLTAVSLAVIDVIYVLTGAIDSIYLLDALLEAVFVYLWAKGWSRALRAAPDGGEAAPPAA